MDTQNAEQYGHVVEVHGKICGSALCGFSDVNTMSKDAQERSAPMKKLCIASFLWLSEESWIFLYFIRNLEINPSYDFVVPFSVTKMGEIALKTEIDFHYKVVIYNPKNDNMRDIRVIEKETVCYCSPIVNYVESFISPKEYYWSEKLHSQFGKPIWE
ncbi:hypothetical protein KY290_007584 [Solanum tuberosum]|uniref:Uncharacterized protein n=1 Tax=Solanum tuberosum TaxID=4113 RepID=A0ABQ7W7X3_SOLTU|nr:hypothetical protein KY290_007584 [Solanum tuberosum]